MSDRTVRIKKFPNFRKVLNKVEKSEYFKLSISNELPVWPVMAFLHFELFKKVTLDFQDILLS